MEIKGLVLAGGTGTRLRPITHTRAKQLVPVAGKPVLYYGLESLRDAGIEDVAVVVGDTEAEIREAVGDGSRFGLSVTYIRQLAPLGLAHAVSVARPWLGDASFCMYLGDNLLVDGIRPLVERFRAGGMDALIFLQAVPDPSAFGVAELAAGRVVRLVEKPARPRSDLALVGVYLFGPAVHGVIDRLVPSERGELEITEAIQGLIDDGAVVVPHVVTGWWKDLGQIDDLLAANRLVLGAQERRIAGAVVDSTVEGRVIVCDDAEVVRSRLIGPVYVGSGASVIDAEVGPFVSISARATVYAAAIVNSIVLEEARISGPGLRLEASLVGRAAAIARSPMPSGVVRVMVGDQSSVELA